MVYIYRYSFGRWALLCLLFSVCVTLAIRQYSRGVDPNVRSTVAASVAHDRPEPENPCKGVVYRSSADGVHFVRENGGGTVFAARVNQQVGYFHLNAYGYLVPVSPATVSKETAGTLNNALLQCAGPWLPSGVRFDLSANAEDQQGDLY